jgi:hypothetical protein
MTMKRRRVIRSLLPILLFRHSTLVGATTDAPLNVLHLDETREENGALILTEVET